MKPRYPARFLKALLNTAEGVPATPNIDRLAGDLRAALSGKLFAIMLLPFTVPVIISEIDLAGGGFYCPDGFF